MGDHMITVLFILASGLAFAGAYFWLRAMSCWLDGDYPDESNRSFPEPLVTTFRVGERGGGVVPRVARPERRGTPPLDKWMLIAQGMKARLR